MKKMIWLALLFASSVVWADPTFDSAKQFHELFWQALPSDMQKDPAAKLLHFVPDDSILKAAQATSISQAMDLVKDTTVDTLSAATAKLGEPHSWNARAALKKTPLTVVIVPGIFGEFIRVRPFEDIFARPSQYRDEYNQRIDQASKELAYDPSYSSATLQEEPTSLKTLVQVGSIDDVSGHPLVKVVFLYPAYGSLETLGDLHARAAMLNRRLEKYLKIMGPQNLVFVGYSRGTTFALEMLSQAKKNQASWLKEVKGLIGLSGVVWGSTSADQTADPKEPMYQTVRDTQALSDALELLTPDMTFYQKVKAKLYNVKVIAQFAARMAQRAKNGSSLDITKIVTSKYPLLASALHIDFMSSSIFLYQALDRIVFKNPDSSSIQKAKNLINAALVGVDQLRTEQRLDWWKTADLPDSVTYYGLTAIMPNPQDSELSQQMFKSDVAFAQGSFEDQFLMKGRNDYLKASSLKANDSQVAIPQAMFLPNVIHSINPSLPPLKTQFLGTIGTHHWGAALKIVFDMQGGKTNPFPREALLKAMAEKVALDQMR